MIRPSGKRIDEARPVARVTRRRAVLAAALAACGAALMGVGLGSILREAGVGSAYEELARRSSGGGSPAVAEGDGAMAAGVSRRDWEALRAENPDVAAWVTIAGTDIDLPVVAAADEEAEAWWLRHDLWGAWSASGTPFLDHRVGGAGDRNCVAYGHHMTSTDTMFSQLQRAYEQDVFDGLGELAWDTPDELTRMAPLMAVKVDQGWADVQAFDWEGIGDEAFRAWLAGLCAQASARAPAWEALVASAKRCVCLVTCSSAWSGQPWRTVCAWCA